MTTFVLDTNVLLRFLVGDLPQQQKRAEQWFKEAEVGRRAIIVTPIVIAEASFVLESFYKQAREAIATALEVFVSERWLRVEERDVLQRLWTDYRAGLHFVDSYLNAWARTRGCEILTFDQKLARRG